MVVKSECAYWKYWLPAFLLLSVSWLFAPWLHSAHVGHLVVISSYEAVGQQWSWLFRSCDILAATILALVVYKFRIVSRNKPVGWLLYTVAALAAVDGMFAIGCGPGGCSTWQTVSHAIHDGESAVAAVVIGAATIVDIWQRRRLGSVLFLVAQVLAGALAVSGLVSHQSLMTLQFVYQVTAVAWLGWIVHYYQPARSSASPVYMRKVLGWIAAATGLLLLLEAFHVGTYIPLLRPAVFTHEIWLIRHGVVAGLVLLYLARHIYAGQRRAALLLLGLLVMQIFRYSLFAPEPILLAGSLAATLLLVMNLGSFDRNSVASNFENRLRDAGVVLAGVLLAVIIFFVGATYSGKALELHHSVAYLYSTEEAATDKITIRRTRHFRQATDAFLVTFGVVVAWSLFRPAGKSGKDASVEEIARAAKLLERYGRSSEDFFKLWPQDKSYMFSDDGKAFLAYKVAGAVVFVLADPVGTLSARRLLLSQALQYFNRQGWSVCVLGVMPDSREQYMAAGLKTVAIGSAAVISIEKFTAETARNKWWRWQLNRVNRNGLTYSQQQAPHSQELLAELADVSAAWLTRAGHREQTFALGYYDSAYMNRCTVHCLRSAEGNLVAFANQLPTYNRGKQATVDLIRFTNEGVNGAMPVLISNIIQQLKAEGGYKTFDLGFVPLAKLENTLATIARRLMARRYAAAGLEQFKDKFEPDWQTTYIAYTGDVVELGKIATSIEKVLRLG